MSARAIDTKMDKEMLYFEGKRSSNRNEMIDRITKGMLENDCLVEKTTVVSSGHGDGYETIVLEILNRFHWIGNTYEVTIGSWGNMVNVYQITKRLNRRRITEDSHDDRSTDGQ